MTPRRHAKQAEANRKARRHKGQRSKQERTTQQPAPPVGTQGETGSGTRRLDTWAASKQEPHDIWNECAESERGTADVLKRCYIVL